MTDNQTGGAAENDPGLLSLALAAQHYGKPLRLTDARSRFGLPDGAVAFDDLLRVARQSGFKADTRTLDIDDLTALPGGFPLLARLNNGAVVVVVGVRRADDGARIGVFDPQARPAGVLDLTVERFAAAWSGETLFLKPRFGLVDPTQPFGLKWFVPELWRQRTAFRDVALAAFALHAVGLATPIYFQIVIDKVLTHRSMNTFIVLTVGVAVALLFESAFRFLRQYVLLIAANKIDVRLMNLTFARLLSLPVSYFEERSAGVTVRHMQQVEKIREFLTGQLLSTALDAVVLLAFLPMLFYYSGQLTAVVLGFAALIAAVLLAVTPIYRDRLLTLYAADAERQAMLVETIHGMRTVKSSATEELQARHWDRRAAETVEAHFRVGRVALSARALMELAERSMTVAVIAVGTFSVFDGQLSVGALIAFQMLSGRVTAPLTQIVSLIHQYQDVLLSVRMLGEVMNHPPERRGGGAATTLRGGVTLEGVGFRYRPDRPPALTDVSFSVPPGALIGVVGKSGSGKSTLMRLLQGLYPLEEGRIRFDGVDLREIDMAHLRRSIGVVLQDSFLFRGSIRDNIAMTLPHAPTEAVIEAAKLAGADEFIARLPHGYETLIHEGADNLSGGQRQRIAIARALLPGPRLLILDEATSALDPDSEAVVMENLGRIAHGRTVLMASHRLSTLTSCDAIIVLEDGKLADFAPHDRLLTRCEPYRLLWARQNHGRG